MQYYISDDVRPELREDFITFIQIKELSAEYIFNVILKTCKNLGLNMDNLVGQGYDGVSTFSGHITGVHKRIQELYPKAIYVHCASHRLNLVLSDSLSVPSIRNCLGVVNEISTLFRNNSQASELLKTNIIKLVPDTKKTRLVGLCETRFVERQVTVNTFIELFPAVVNSLQELSCVSRAISISASSLLASIEKGSFLVALMVCEYVFSLTLPLSNYLQKPEHDLSASLKYADDIIKALCKLRESGTSNFDVQQFSNIFEKAQLMAQKILFTTIDIPPRQAKMQQYRENHPHNSAEEYFRRSIFIPCIDGLISALVARFDNNRDILSAFQVLLPRNANPQSVDAILKLKMYYEHKTSESVVKAEYLLWCEKWKSEEEKPVKLLTILDECDKNFYPNIRMLLSVLATLPVSTAEVERSFSSLKRIKSFLRNKMENERLTGLALMTIHYPAPFTAEDVLNFMAVNGKRRLLL